ncbi:16S rRNA (cytosine(1402)-N(4))-methyltransferase RsmH [Candidatus Saccharibacteria bacterium]|nr:16S rRNA (cytosine(1402)-N(4))-methyltransferase RsmH [Candidatus Saccharibacteria bacterium]
MPPEVSSHHIPVLLDATLQYLDPQQGNSYLDLTAGYGGHARAVLERTRAASAMTLVDRDENAITALGPLQQQGATLLHSDFLTAAKGLVLEGKRFDLILADLGVSSPQLDVTERGFSFRREAALDMRMDQRAELSAATVVNDWSQEALATAIWRYGEEQKSRRIAEAIVAARPLHATTELADVIQAVVPRRKAIDATMRTFQAIRIAVNEELTLIEGLLGLIPDLLTPGGRVAIISFHSLEDRLVKRFFAEEERSGYEARLRVLTKRPIGGDTHDVTNPRARSAKLRAAVKTKN